MAEAHSPDVLFLLRLGRALHTYGYPAPSLESALQRVAERFDLEAQFFSTPTSLFCSVGPVEAQHTFLLRVEPGEVDLGKLAQLHGTIAEVVNGVLSAEEGSAKIDRIVDAAPVYGPVLTTLAFGCASSGAALFLGGGVREMASSATIGLVIGLLALAVAERRPLGSIFEPLAAAAAAFLAALAAYFVGPLSVYIATLAGLIVLIPGFTLTVALTELATRHLASGTARLMGAAATFLTIGFGVAAGSRLGAALVGPSGAAPPVPPGAWAEWAALLIAPLSFTVLLRARPRDAGWILATGVLAVQAGLVGASLLGPEMGVFFGALAVGAASSLYARLSGRPAAVTLVPGILLLVPGSIGFKSLASLLDKDVVLGVETMFRMIFVAISLVAGLLVASVIVPERRRARG